MTTLGAAILIMAKAARVGLVKTRLGPLLGPVGCAGLQRALIGHACTLSAGVAPTFLAYHPGDAGDEIRALASAPVRLLPQRGEHLGERMSAAVDDLTALGHSPVVVIGTDAPTLTRSDLATALDAHRNGADAVIGPALDGGYYLIGLTSPLPTAFAIDPALWGGPQVLDATLTALDAAGKRVTLLGPLRDLDTPDDATALLHDPGLPRQIAALLRTPARS